MITPRFSLSQDEEYLIINIRAPYCSLKELELYVDGQDFRFVCSPYYLRLNLPGKILDNDSSSGQFLSDKGEFVFKYPKETKGQNFEGLDFITSLLAPSKKEVKQPNIEVLSETVDEVYSENEENEWFIDQKIPIDDDKTLIGGCKYGFANQKFDILRNTEYEFYSVFEIRDADSTTLTDRKKMRLDTESMSFSVDHYLCDYYDDVIIKGLINLLCPWKKFNKETVSFDDDEKDIIKDFPNKEYLLNSEELKIVLNGLLDILYAYCYDKRTTEFEGNCESAWTITKLSATLSWFDKFDSEFEAVTCGFRRSLIYPLYRNFELCSAVLQDLKQLFQLGQVFIVKCLIDIYNIFNSSSDPTYILNDLYIKDYIIFMQKCPKVAFEELIKKLNNVQITKETVNLNLEKIVTDTNRGKDILEKMSMLNISNYETESDSESDSDSSEASSTDSDDSTSSSNDSNGTI